MTRDPDGGDDDAPAALVDEGSGDALPPKCPASLRAGTPGRFGRVICPICRARLKPLTGGRLPVHRGLPRDGADR